MCLNINVICVQNDLGIQLHKCICVSHVSMLCLSKIFMSHDVQFVSHFVVQSFIETWLVFNFLPVCGVKMDLMCPSFYNKSMQKCSKIRNTFAKIVLVELMT